MNFRKGSKRQLTPTPTSQNGPYLWKSCAGISYYLAIIPPCIYATISIIKKLQHNFPQMRGGGQRPFGIFPKIHPIWQRDPSLGLKKNVLVSALGLEKFCLKKVSVSVSKKVSVSVLKTIGLGWNFWSCHSVPNICQFFTQLQFEAKKFYIWKCVNSG